MKKSILLLCLLLANTASAAGISLGMYDGKEYVLQTDSVRFCSTPSCLYIDGQRIARLKCVSAMYHDAGRNI